jgi:hypothetical protein
MEMVIDQFQCRRVVYAEPFDFSHMNNLGAAATRGEYLIFLVRLGRCVIGGSSSICVPQIWSRGTFEHVEFPSASKFERYHKRSSAIQRGERKADRLNSRSINLNYWRRKHEHAKLPGKVGSAGNHPGDTRFPDNLSSCLGYIPIFACLIDAASSQLVVTPTGPM